MNKENTTYEKYFRIGSTSSRLFDWIGVKIKSKQRKEKIMNDKELEQYIESLTEEEIEAMTSPYGINYAEGYDCYEN